MDPVWLEQTISALRGALNQALALKLAQAKSDREAQARRMLPPGSSRARVTTANARWSRAAEERDRLLRELRGMLAAISEDA